MKHILLLRAHGDFIITLINVSNSKSIKDFYIHASAHFLPLYNAIPDQYKNTNLQIEFVDWGINSSMFGLYTNKRLLHPNSIKEVKKIKQWLQKQTISDEWILEQDTRKKWIETFVGRKFKHIVSGQNIYEQNNYFFQSKPIQIDYDPSKVQHILILPSARLAFRNIPKTLIQSIQHYHQQKKQDVQVAFFKPQLIDFKENLKAYSSYNSFTELINYILAADYIYTPDSLSAHLAYLFGKPHTILHPAKVSPSFFTPYALQHKTHYSFAEFQLS